LLSLSLPQLAFREDGSNRLSGALRALRFPCDCAERKCREGQLRRTPQVLAWCTFGATCDAGTEFAHAVLGRQRARRGLHRRGTRRHEYCLLVPSGPCCEQGGRNRRMLGQLRPWRLLQPSGFHGCHEHLQQRLRFRSAQQRRGGCSMLGRSSERRGLRRRRVRWRGRRLQHNHRLPGAGQGRRQRPVLGQPRARGRLPGRGLHRRDKRVLHEIRLRGVRGRRRAVLGWGHQRRQLRAGEFCERCRRLQHPLLLSGFQQGPGSRGVLGRSFPRRQLRRGELRGGLRRVQHRPRVPRRRQGEWARPVLGK